MTSGEAGENGAATGWVILDPERVRLALVCKQLTQAQVAQGAGISQDTVRKMVHGQRVQPHKAAAVIRYLDDQPDCPGFAEYVSCA